MDKLIRFWPMLVQIIQVPIVIFLFRSSGLPKQYVGLLGSVIFISVAIYFMNYFYRKLEFKSYALYALMGHLFLFIIPILSIRLAFWGTDFNEIQIGNLAASSIHSLSEKFYIIVLLATAHDCFHMPKKLLERQNELNEEA